MKFAISIIIFLMLLTTVFSTNVSAQSKIESENYKIHFPDLNFGAVIPKSKSSGQSTTPSNQPTSAASPISYIEVYEFKAPLIVDSFMNVLYSLQLKNNGSTSWKVNKNKCK